MKRILLLASIMLISLVGLSQSNYETYKTVVGKWNESKKQFVYSEPTYQVIEIELLGNVVSIKDEAHSVYITRNKKTVVDTRDYAIHAWDAIDEGNRDCRLLISKDKYTYSITVLYNDYLIEYFIK